MEAYVLGPGEGTALHNPITSVVLKLRGSQCGDATNVFEIDASPGEGPPLHFHEEQDEWLYVLDHCAAVELVLRRGAEGQIYNVGSGVEIENLELTRRILALLGRPALAARLLLRRLAVAALRAPALAALQLLAAVGVGGRRGLALGLIDAALAARVCDVFGPPGAVVVALGEASGRIRIPAGTDLGHRSVLLLG